MDTIFALSSGHLPSGVAVIRLSGNEVVSIIKTIAKKIPSPRYMQFGALYSKDNEILDHGLIVYFKAPYSFTGEDCAEFHIHGGKAVVARFLNELSTFNHCRMAEAGEFARRAFYNNKIDLTEAEGLADLIEAETESQRKLAAMGASGKLAELYRSWRQSMIKARALIEAELDFSDEADVPGSVSDQIWLQMRQLQHDIKHHLKAGEFAGVLRDGLKIVIAGAPNSGKSSLINKLANRDVAIVTDIAGTTRDILETRIQLAGLPVFISDTAGLRKTDNKIERIGVEKAKEHLQEADLVLHLSDMHNSQLLELPDIKADIWHIGNKLDQGVGDKTRYPIQLSVLTGQGFDQLVEKLTQYCQSFFASMTELIPVRQRQVDLLKIALQELALAIESDHLDLELRAEHLRLASNNLGRITGDIDVEDLLDVIFSEFCIGK